MQFGWGEQTKNRAEWDIEQTVWNPKNKILSASEPLFSAAPYRTHLGSEANDDDGTASCPAVKGPDLEACGSSQRAGGAGCT